MFPIPIHYFENYLFFDRAIHILFIFRLLSCNPATESKYANSRLISNNIFEKLIFFYYKNFDFLL